MIVVAIGDDDDDDDDDDNDDDVLYLMDQMHRWKDLQILQLLDVVYVIIIHLIICLMSYH